MLLSEASTAAGIGAPQAAAIPRAGRGLRKRADPTTPSLLLAAPLGLFFVAFFAAPLLILIFVSLHNDAEMTPDRRRTIRQVSDRPVQPQGPQTHLVAGGRGDCGLPPPRLSLGRSVRAVPPKCPGCADVDHLVAAADQRRGEDIRLDRHSRTTGDRHTALLALGIADAPLGLLYTEGGLVVALAQVQMLLMVLPVITSLQKIDPNLADASAALGAGAWRTLFRVTLPLSLPGIVAGSLLTYAAAITALITQTLIVDGQKLFMPMYIYQQSSTLQNWPFAAAIAIIFLVAVVGGITILSTLGRMHRGFANG